MGENLNFLVVGCGSIGQRHISNLKDLAVGEIIACDTDSEKLTRMNKCHGIQKNYTKLQKAMKQDIDVVLVCTPPSTHISIAMIAVEHNAHVFIEKPMSDSLDGVKELLKKATGNGVMICVGYNFRFHEGLKLVRELLDKGQIGRALSVKAEFGQHLPDWRPWQDYRQSYTAKRNLGGGIILDGSHEIDYLRWLIGDIETIFCLSDKISSLEVETEDIAEILLHFKNGVIGHIHLDFIRPGYTRTCEIVGEDGVIKWSYEDGFVKTYSKETSRWNKFDIMTDSNEMYVQELQHFIECVNTNKQPLIDGQEGLKSLEMALLAKRSAEIKEMVLV